MPSKWSTLARIRSRLTNKKTSPLKGFRDGALKVPIPFSLGFAKPGPTNPFGSPGSFGHAGSGGSFGFADPELETGYGYVLNGMGTYLTDPRDRALRTAMYRSIGVTDPYLRER